MATKTRATWTVASRWLRLRQGGQCLCRQHRRLRGANVHHVGCRNLCTLCGSYGSSCVRMLSTTGATTPLRWSCDLLFSSTVTCSQLRVRVRSTWSVTCSFVASVNVYDGFDDYYVLNVACTEVSTTCYGGAGTARENFMFVIVSSPAANSVLLGLTRFGPVQGV